MRNRPTASPDYRPSHRPQATHRPRAACTCTYVHHFLARAVSCELCRVESAGRAQSVHSSVLQLCSGSGVLQSACICICMCECECGVWHSVQIEQRVPSVLCAVCCVGLCVAVCSVVVQKECVVSARTTDTHKNTDFFFKVVPRVPAQVPASLRRFLGYLQPASNLLCLRMSAGISACMLCSIAGTPEI
jgi:hypothetical protein